jgi:ElaB/YqjD/DUF883 family membrane-anchored ribosome-binding protein
MDNAVSSNRSMTMPNRNWPADNPLKDSAEAIGEQATNRANEAKESMSDMARTATDKVNEGRETAADQLDGAASTVHDRADQLPGGPKVKEFAHAAADRLSTTADYMRSHDATRMMADVESLLKNNPGLALFVAAAFGFFIGRALSRD